MAVPGQQQALVSSSARATNGKSRGGLILMRTYKMIRNVSERLGGEIQTNQRAELTAVVRALELSKRHQKVRIFTDSKYTIDCATNWYRSWAKNDWKKSNGDDVLNQDLVKQIRALIDKRDKAGYKTLFQWVKGHAANAGNIAADKLAVAGARKR